jgi:hypothetical protein
MLHLQNRMDVTRFLRAGDQANDEKINESRKRLGFNGPELDEKIVEFMTRMVFHVIDKFKGGRDHKKKEYGDDIHIENGSSNAKFMAVRNKDNVSQYFKLAILINCIKKLEVDVEKFNDIPGGPSYQDMLKYSQIEVQIKHYGWFRFVFYYFDNGLDNYQVHVGMRKLTYSEYFGLSK